MIYWPCFLFSWSPHSGSPLSAAPTEPELPDQLSRWDFPGVHTRLSVSYTGYLPLGEEEKGGAHALVSSEHHFSTLTGD